MHGTIKNRKSLCIRVTLKQQPKCNKCNVRAGEAAVAKGKGEQEHEQEEQELEWQEEEKEQEE